MPARWWLAYSQMVIYLHSPFRGAQSCSIGSAPQWWCCYQSPSWAWGSWVSLSDVDISREGSSIHTQHYIDFFLEPLKTTHTSSQISFPDAKSFYVVPGGSGPYLADCFSRIWRPLRNLSFPLHTLRGAALGEKQPWLLGWIFKNFRTQEKPRGSVESSADQVRGSLSR